MANSHTFELGYNGVILSGELDLTNSKEVDLRIDSAIDVHLHDFQAFIDLVETVRRICEHCGDINHLRIEPI